ncbi:PREDICTED: SH2 domain-containing protein 2A [Crocodylus porosus]|uniref:SH2 domain-containing protein 2A n=1 Tax=Crocodylus porosus TaxID=8502 RepID=UPI00093DFB53|nr:PREDICTED: SH2 domain-containing protein 2A [Crocodylus porosus]
MDFAVQPGPGRGADGLEPPEPLLFSTFHPLGLGRSEGSAPALEGHREALAGSQQGQLHPSSQREQAPSSQTPSASAARLPWLVPGSDEAVAALRASTQAWFEQTQASGVLPDGQRPDWFHGFLSRRESEQLLQDKPLGCYLIRFSESTVGFVLSYRGWDRCRHYILDQLEDGHYVILGEDSAHARLQELLQHYTSAPIHPYYELLTVPCAWNDKDPVGTRIPAGAEAAMLPHAALSPAYSVVHKQRQATGQGCSSPEAACPGPLLPAKATRVPSSPWTDTAPPTSPSAPEAKYQQLLRFHTYAEPREGPVAPERRIYHEPDEPIPFYAVGRGSPRDLSPENIYSEVDVAQEVQLAISTLPPGLSQARMLSMPHRLHRSVSSQGSRRRWLPAAPSRDRGSSRPSSPVLQMLPPPQLEFDDPIYSKKVPAWSSTMHATGQEGLENIYELLPGDRPLSPGTGGCKA